MGTLRAVFSSFNSSTVVNTSQVKGLTNGSAPAAGTIGELFTSTVPSGSATSLTTATTANVAGGGINPTAGEWFVYGSIDFILTGATATNFTGGASLTSATLPTQAGGSGLGTDPLFVDPIPTTTLTGTLTKTFATTLRVSATTSVFLVAQATFSVGTVTAYGTLSARRVG